MLHCCSVLMYNIMYIHIFILDTYYKIFNEFMYIIQVYIHPRGILYLIIANRIYFLPGDKFIIYKLVSRTSRSFVVLQYLYIYIILLLYTLVSSIDAKYQNKKTHALAYRLLQVRLTFTFCTNILYYTHTYTSARIDRVFSF